MKLENLRQDEGNLKKHTGKFGKGRQLRNGTKFASFLEEAFKEQLAPSNATLNYMEIEGK